MIKRSLIVSAAIGFTATALIASTSAQAAPYHVIKWDVTRMCQVYDFGTGKPMLSDYKVLTKPLPSFSAASSAEKSLWRKGKC